jgi:hypothetical protein
MNTRILLLAISAGFLSSCSTMYKSGQTPDDVYYSPGREQPAAVQTDEDPKKNRKFTDEYTDESYLRMKSSSRRWSAFDDDYMYWNNPTWNSQMMFNSWGSPYYGMGYSTGYGYGYSSWHIGFSSFWGSPYYLYNPFCPIYYGQPVVIINPKPVYKNPVANGPRTYNLHTYNTPNRNNQYKGKYVDPKLAGSAYDSPNYPGTSANPGRSGVRVFNNVSAGSGSTVPSNYSGSGSSSRPRGGYSNNDNSDSRNSDKPTRTFEPSRNNNSSSGSSSSGTRSSGGSGSSGSSAPTRTFSKGGGSN